MSEEKIVVPSHAIVDVDNINKVMKILFSKFLGKEVTKNELSKEVELKPKALGRILSILHSFDFIAYTQSRKKAKISRTGTEYAHQLAEEKENKAREILSAQIEKTALWKRIVEFVDKECSGKHGTTSGLGFFLMKTQNKTWAPLYQKLVAEKTCEIMNYANKIDYNKDEETFTLKEPAGEKGEEGGGRNSLKGGRGVSTSSRGRFTRRGSPQCQYRFGLPNARGSATRIHEMAGKNGG